MLPPQIIFGYHGCDESVAQMILAGGHLRASSNPWDWLGHGIYFWERSISRAMRWAEEVAEMPHSVIKKPTVIGSLINLGHCLDLADPDSAELVSDAYQSFTKHCDTNSIDMPSNKGPESKARFLDCAALASLPAFDTVRGFFNEGQPVYPTAGLRSLDHVQVCVRNPKCILGFFKPARLDA